MIIEGLEVLPRRDRQEQLVRLQNPVVMGS